MSRLEHYAAQPVTLERRVYELARGDCLSRYDKPNGLWISVAGEDDWPSWCRDEKFNLDGLAWRHIVFIDPGARILRPDDLGQFEADYGRQFQWGPGNRYIDLAIDWQAVANEYDGIIIAPYQWAERLTRHWYYTWDCASGCVWNTDALTLGPAESLCGTTTELAKRGLQIVEKDSSND